MPVVLGRVGRGDVSVFDVLIDRLSGSPARVAVSAAAAGAEPNEVAGFEVEARRRRELDGANDRTLWVCEQDWQVDCSKN